MMHFQVPRRLSPNECPSLPRLVQLVLCDDGWARIDAYRLAYEHVYGIKLREHEAEEHIRRKVAIQQRLRSFPASRASTHDLNIPSNFASHDEPADKGGIDYSLSDEFADLSLDNGYPTQHDPSLDAPTSRVLQERPRMERASTSTSGVSVVVPHKDTSVSGTRKDSIATLASSTSGPWVGHPSSCGPRTHPPSSDVGDQDREYKHWGRLDDPDSVWNKLHVERPKLDERKRFSSYMEYKKTRNQPMKDNDQLFKKRVRQSFAMGEVEVLSVDNDNGDEDGGDTNGEETERGGERTAVNRVESKRQILLVKRKGNLAGQNL